jgi:hypothetical protein
VVQNSLTDRAQRAGEPVEATRPQHHHLRILAGFVPAGIARRGRLLPQPGSDSRVDAGYLLIVPADDDVGRITALRPFKIPPRV